MTPPTMRELDARDEAETLAQQIAANLRHGHYTPETKTLIDRLFGAFNAVTTSRRTT